ncbi:FAD-dependent monooxygenase, partial [Streptomyces sp. NPDC057927]
GHRGRRGGRGALGSPRRLVRRLRRALYVPFGGQGLNLGIGDAMNLGWKLGAVVAGWALEGLLDTYDAERRPLGAWVLDWTRAQVGVMRGDAKSAALREVVADLLSTRDGTTYAVKKISGVTQRVDLPGDHPLVGRYVPDLWLTDGSRLSDHGHGGGFLLLDRTPDGTFARLAAAWAGRVRIVTDDHATPTGVLVRPDGVVAWASDTTDVAATTGLEAALHGWAGAPTPSPEHAPMG